MHSESEPDDPSPVKPSARDRLQRETPHAAPELDEIEESGHATASVPGRDLPATGDPDRIVELDSSYWIG